MYMNTSAGESRRCSNQNMGYSMARCTNKETRTVTAGSHLLIAVATIAVAIAARANGREPDSAASLEAASDASAPGAAASELQEVTVTARKRQESVQTVPISIAVVTGDALQVSGARNISDLTQLVPNVTMPGGSAQSVYAEIGMRGISTQNRNIGLESDVGVYVDGVYIARPGAANFDLVDIDHVEVLRGPQGTLFGKNTLGGAISMTTVSPGTSWGGFVQAEGGNLNHRNARALISGPVLEHVLSVKFTGAIVDRDGYYNNLGVGAKEQDVNYYSLGTQIHYTPTGNLTIDLRGDGSFHQEHPLYAVSLSGLNHTPTSSPFDTYQNQYNFLRRNVYGGSLTAQYTFPDGFSLQSISAYRVMHWHTVWDSDYTISPFVNTVFGEGAQSYSQEVRLLSPQGNSFDFVTGIFYLHLKATRPNQVISSPALTGTDDPVSSEDSVVTTESFAPYFQGNWHITDRLTLTAGARYTQEQKQLQFREFGAVIFPSIPVAADGSYYKDSLESNSFSPALSLNYQWSDSVMAYAAISHAYKSGGFNVDTQTILPSGQPLIEFAPEKANSYEVGAKTTWLDKRLRLNMAAFLLKIDDLQVLQTVPVGNVVTNAGAATSTGLEAELAARPIPSLELSAGVGYTHAYYNRYVGCGTSITADCQGQTLRDAPPLSGSLAATYTHPLVGAWKVSAHSEFTYVGERYFDVPNIPEAVSRAYGLVNVRFGASSENLDVSVWSRNLFNRLYTTYESATGFPLFNQTAAFYGEPRTYGARATYRF
jgi:iron complex outermembrane receptor protein